MGRQAVDKPGSGGWVVAKIVKTLMLHGWRNEQLGVTSQWAEDTGHWPRLAWVARLACIAWAPSGLAAKKQAGPDYGVHGRKYVLLLFGLFPVNW